jgi:hypothetical protein
MSEKSRYESGSKLNPYKVKVMSEITRTTGLLVDFVYCD